MIKIDKKENCCGCTACVAICPKSCIEMKEDLEGFLYPQVDEKKCVECGACERVCPLNDEHNIKNKVLSACIVQNKNKEILRQSTSGGAFTPIAEYVIDNGGVVFGVAMEIQDCFVKHIKVQKKEELGKFRSSKYVQSYVGDTFTDAKKELNTGRLVCFSGTPCQIQGLKNYLHRSYDNLITVDVVCRGVPSPGIWKKYIEYLKVKGKLSSVKFRDKTLGYQYSTMEIKYCNGRIDRNGIESDQWLRMFFSGMTLRPSCSHCNFRVVERCSDFTIWDCFNVSDLTKDIDETKGATRMLIHSDKGLEIFNNIKDKYYVVNSSVDRIAMGISENVYENEKKEQFIKDFNQMGMDMLINKWFPVTVAIRFKKFLRRLLNIVGIDLFVKKIKRKIKK